METLPSVDGNLMVRTLARMEAPHFEVPDVDYLEQQIVDINARRVELEETGFLAQAQEILEETLPKLNKKLNHVDKLSTIQEWRDKGFFVINTPEWTDTEIIDGVEVPYKLTSRTSWRNLMSMHQDYQALYYVPIRNWRGDVPMCVTEAIREFGDKFTQLGIMFVAKRSALENLVRKFVKQDPVLVGSLRNCPEHMVVLKMWGSDMKSISLELLNDKSSKLNHFR